MRPCHAAGEFFIAFHAVMPMSMKLINLAMAREREGGTQEIAAGAALSWRKLAVF